MKIGAHKNNIQILNSIGYLIHQFLRHRATPKYKKKIKENKKLRNNSMPTNINYNTLDAILEEKSNFKII